MGSMDGKVVVITGAGAGIGRAHAHLFASEGAKVVINDLGGDRDGAGQSRTAADGVVDEIRGAGGEAVAHYGSVTDPESAEDLIRSAFDTFGRLDILVNNAGILRDKTLVKMDDSMWHSVVDVHLTGSFYCARAAARAMVEQGEGGRIIYTSSIAGLKGNYGQSNYAAAKAGIYGMTMTQSLELRKHGITVNAVAPMAKTRMTDDIDAVGNELTPDMISPVVVYLAGDDAAHLTGRIIGAHGPHIFEYRMEMNEGARKKDGSIFTIAEIGERWNEITSWDSPETDTDEEAESAPLLAAIFEAFPCAFRAEAAGDWRAVIHYDLAGSDGYTLRIEDGQCESFAGLQGDPTCIVQAKASLYADMVTGKTSPQDAFMQGKVVASFLPDMMNFGNAFDLATVAATVTGVEPAPTESAPEGMNRDCIGRRYTQPAAYCVGVDEPLDYANATNDANAAYRAENAIAPPLYAVRLIKDSFIQAVGDPDLRADFLMLLHGEQDLVFHAPIYAGDQLTINSEIEDIESKATGELLSLGISIRRGDDLVVDGKSAFFVRSRTKKKSGESKPAPPPPPEPDFTSTMVVTEDQPLRYADASGDDNPIHTDDATAQAAGHPRKILQGLCTMAFASQAVVNEVSAGDPLRLRRLKVRFARPVLPGDTLETKIISLESSTDCQRYGLRMVNQDGIEVLSQGLAEVRPS